MQVIWNDLHFAHISICMVVGLKSQDFNSTTNIYRERGVQENRVFLNTACTLMCERVRVWKHKNNKINKLKIIINNLIVVDTTSSLLSGNHECGRCGCLLSRLERRRCGFAASFAAWASWRSLWILSVSALEWRPPLPLLLGMVSGRLVLVCWIAVGCSAASGCQARPCLSRLL